MRRANVANENKNENVKQEINLFEGRRVRTAWDSDTEKWYFSVVDVCGVLTESKNPTDYLKKLRKREPELSTYLGTNCPQVLMTTESGKLRLTLAASSEHLSHIILFINSPKEEEFREWIEQITSTEETVWLTQSQIIDLFLSSKSNISEHIANIYEQGELVYGATVRNFRTVQKEGNRTGQDCNFKSIITT